MDVYVVMRSAIVRSDSAKYGTYTLMDEKTNLIIEFSLCCSGDWSNIIKCNGVRIKAVREH